jgi:DNA helicase-2/ATP-dependent DNA helicase PcrA
MISAGKKLNSEQLKAVAHSKGPLLIVAGAGTGKTTVLVERLKYLIENNLAKPDEILIATFTEKAAGEMEERADKVLPYGYVELWINTFHGFCERILRDHALDIGIPADFKLLNQAEQWALIRKNQDKFNLDYYRPLGNPTKFIFELIKHFSRLKDENIAPQEYLEYAEGLEQNKDAMLGGNKKIKKNKEDSDENMEASRISELANAYHVYNQLLLDNSFLDFGDLIVLALKLFKERPNILKIYRDKFKYIMVDEFQDTNWSQYELIKILSAPNNNLVVVGDDDQSIYKFRGASISNIMQFKDDYPEAKEVVLAKNYRSGKNILDIAYKFINYNNPNRLEIKLGLNKKLEAQKKDNGLAEHNHFFSEGEETAGIADKIIELYKKEKETNWSDFAILVRANDTADKFVAELTRRQIPNLFVSLRGLYYKPIILDCLAFLKLLDNYHESSALYRVLNMEIFKASHEDIVNINKFARKKVLSTYEALLNIQAVPGISPEGAAGVNKLLALIRKHSQAVKKNPPAKVFLDFIRDSGLLESLDYSRNAVIFDYLNQFYQRMKKSEASEPDFRLKDFLNMIKLELEAGETGRLKIFQEDSDLVKIMTVHAAKGLEFKYVFVPCMVDKKFPAVNRPEKISIPDALVREKLPEGDTHIEEERRLFYVALTRAESGIFLTSASDYGGEREKRPSKFLEEAGLVANPKKQEMKKINAVNGLIKDLGEIQKKEIKPEIKTKHDLPAKFSFSRLEAYSNCPLQYKFSYILKIPVEEKANFIFGKAIHNALRDFFISSANPEFLQGSLFKKEEGEKNGSAKPTLEDLKKIYEKNWQADGYQSKEERESYKKKGAEILKLFYEKLNNGGWPEILFLEKNFNIRIGEYRLSGAIDRIDMLPDGTAEIIDYKTGNPKKQLLAGDKRQLLIYKIAVQQLLGLNVSKLTYYYLDNNSPLSFSGKEKEEKKLIEEIIREIKEIEKGDFSARPGFLCGYCDFRDICEFRK